MAYQITDDLGRTKYFDHNHKLHRLDGPAVIYRSGREYWYLHGLQHRHDGPSVYSSRSADEIWHLLGKRHRLGGPAYIYHNGDKSWYQHGKYHRLDGPAIEWSSQQLYYVDGNWCQDIQEYNQQVQEWNNKCKTQ